MTITRILALLSVMALLASLPIAALAQGGDAPPVPPFHCRWHMPPSTANQPWKAPWSSPWSAMKRSATGTVGMDGQVQELWKSWANSGSRR